MMSNNADGAGEGNRTLVFSLEGYCSTIELHPRAAQRRAGPEWANHHAPPLAVKSAPPSNLHERQPVNTPPDLLEALINELAPFRPARAGIFDGVGDVPRFAHL